MLFNLMLRGFSAADSLCTGIAWVHYKLDAYWTWVRVFAWILAGCIVADLILVFNGYTSISMTTWIQTQQHPTLIGAGNMGMCYTAYLVRRCVVTVFLAGVVNGHMFLHW